jgi:hypothetical protein
MESIMQVLDEMDINSVSGAAWYIAVRDGLITEAIYNTATAVAEFIIDGIRNPQNYDTSYTQLMDPMGNYTGYSVSDIEATTESDSQP